MNVILEPKDDRLLSYPELGKRWGVAPGVARKRLDKFNVPVVQWSRTAVGIRLSDIIRIESQLTKTREVKQAGVVSLEASGRSCTDVTQ